MTTTNTTVSPTLVPPHQRSSRGHASKGSGAAGQSRPRDIVLDAPPAALHADGPAMEPPGTPGASGAVSAVAGTWTTSVLVDGTWTINEHRNAYLHVAGGGWKKIFNGTDAAFAALVTLVAQAKQTHHPLSLREEADGMVHEVYLW